MFHFSELENDTLRAAAIVASGLNTTEFSLEDFNYQNNVIQELMMRELSQTNFTGVTVSCFT